MAETPKYRQRPCASAAKGAAFYAGFQSLSRPKPTSWDGTRVVLAGDHPWAAPSGLPADVVEGEEIVMSGKALKVKLDDGFSCYVLDPAQIRSVTDGG
jgi:hypothetical protein